MTSAYQRTLEVMREMEENEKTGEDIVCIKNLETRHPEYGEEFEFNAIAYNGFMHALQKASDLWFGGQKVTDYQRGASNGKDAQYLLLSSSQNGNVIGRVYVRF